MQKAPQCPGREPGFTLIELMITVAIVGILAAIAYPSYTQYIIRSNRAEGKALLMDVAAREERFFSNNNSYTENMTQLGFAADPATSEHGLYTVDATVTGATYSLTATTAGRQTADTKCGNLTLNSTGAKSQAGTSTDCW